MPAAVDLVAYRAVQESLTNVRKHAGDAAVVVELDYRPDVFRPDRDQYRDRPWITASRPRTPNSTSGFGLMGMRERVGSVGGEVRAAPTADGGFVITVRLPVDEEMLSR